MNKDSTNKSVAIIGSGVAGIATSIRLANDGFDVTVFEKEATFGGKLGVLELGGYRFDTGPSLFTMPQYVDELLNIDGKKDVEFGYTELQEVCNYFWDDKTRLNVTNDTEQLAASFEKQLGESKENVKRFLNRSKEIYEITDHVFLQSSLHKLKTYLKKKTLKSLLKLHKIGLLKSMNKANTSYFKTEKAAQFFNRYSTYNGSNPFQAPATLNVIQHYETGFGAFFPTNGMRSIIEALHHKAIGLGVKFILNTPINNVAKEEGAYLINNKDKFDFCVCNIDISSAAKGPLTGLLSKTKKSYTPSSSALIFYWGMDRQFEELTTHNVFFSKNYRSEFDTLFNDRGISKDPTVYVHISSKVKTTDAPKNAENWFVMVNAPYTNDQDWDSIIAETRTAIIKKVSDQLKVDIEAHIAVEEMLTPTLIYKKTGSFKGALYGSSSNSILSAFLRKSNFSTKHKGLYFVGGSVHPGGGIPLCLLSAKITSEIIRNNVRKD